MLKRGFKIISASTLLATLDEVEDYSQEHDINTPLFISSTEREANKSFQNPIPTSSLYTENTHPDDYFVFTHPHASTGTRSSIPANILFDSSKFDTIPSTALQNLCTGEHKFLSIVESEGINNVGDIQEVLTNAVHWLGSCCLWDFYSGSKPNTQLKFTSKSKETLRFMAQLWNQKIKPLLKEKFDSTPLSPSSYWDFLLSISEDSEFISEFVNYCSDFLSNNYEEGFLSLEKEKLLSYLSGDIVLYYFCMFTKLLKEQERFNDSKDKEIFLFVFLEFIYKCSLYTSINSDYLKRQIIPHDIITMPIHFTNLSQMNKVSDIEDNSECIELSSLSSTEKTKLSKTALDVLIYQVNTRFQLMMADEDNGDNV